MQFRHPRSHVAHGAVTVPQKCGLRTCEKWDNADLFLAIKSTCCNEASALGNVSERSTRAPAVDFKEPPDSHPLEGATEL